MKLNKVNKKIAGFTLDQTILVVAVIAILATIIISSVAFSVLSKANATKIVAHLNQISDAMGQYYQDNGHEYPTNASELAPYLAGYTVSGNHLKTPFSDSSKESLLKIVSSDRSLSKGAAGTCPGEVDCYKLVQLTEIAAEDCDKVDEAIDGVVGNTGRVRISGDTTIVYYAVVAQ